MKHHVNVQLKSQSVAIERFLRVTRHRGFTVVNMSITSSDEHYQVKLEVESDRPLYLLTQQLAKLVDVNQVEVDTINAQSVSA